MSLIQLSAAQLGVKTMDVGILRTAITPGKPTCRALESLCVRRSREGIIVWSPAVGGHLGSQEAKEESSDGSVSEMLHDVVLMVISGKLECLFGL